MVTYLEGVTTVALCALAAPEKTAHSPSALLETAVILHGMGTSFSLYIVIDTVTLPRTLSYCTAQSNFPYSTAVRRHTQDRAYNRCKLVRGIHLHCTIHCRLKIYMYSVQTVEQPQQHDQHPDHVFGEIRTV